MRADAAKNSFILNNRYEVLKQIASGKTGDIYLCCDLCASRQLVALRVLADALVTEPQALTLFLHQFRLAKAFSHSNILQVFDYFEEEDLCIYSMEYLKGGNLSERIQQTNVSFEEIIYILHELCEGLHEVHRSGILHGALHPGNILFTEEGRAKIAGAGFSHLILGNGSRQSADSETAIEYLSPEQFRHGPVDQRADIYTVGLLGYKMITGQLPGNSIKSPEEIQKRFKAEFPGPRTLRKDCPNDLHDIIAKTIRLEPAQRYQTTDELRDALHSCRLIEKGAEAPPVLKVVPDSPERIFPSNAKTDVEQKEFFKPGGFWSTVFLTGFLILIVAAIVFFENNQFAVSDMLPLAKMQETPKERKLSLRTKTEQLSEPASNAIATEQAVHVVPQVSSANLSGSTESIKNETANQFLRNLKAVETTMVEAKGDVENKKHVPVGAPEEVTDHIKEIEAKAVDTDTSIEVAKLEPSNAKVADKVDDIIHTVSYRGETLSIIADWYLGDIRAWKKLAKANPSIVVAQVEIGDKIILPRDLVVNEKPFQKSHIDVVRERMSSK